MQITGEDILHVKLRQHAAARRWIESWLQAAGNSQWKRLGDVRKDYPSADGVKLRSNRVVTVFNVRGNEFRLLTEIFYEDEIVDILDLLTHAEYDKQKF